MIAPAFHDATQLVGTVLAGKFRVDGVLGRGGMGIVTSAWHMVLHQQVALKFLSEDALKDANAVERFMREARASVRLQSAHVARVIDVNTLENGAPYMVMELLEGRDLGRLLDEKRQLPVADAVDYVLEALDAIAEAHSVGIVHRDLKPSNLFLALRADETIALKVLDFGISKLTDEGMKQTTLTSATAVVGSPLYMSPEQVRSARRVDTRADLWSLGVILYEMLAGEPPFTGESVGEVFASVLEASPPKLRDLRPDVPEGLADAIARCLKKNREDRVPTAAELAKLLAPYGSGRAQACVERAMAITLRSSSARKILVDSDTRRSVPFVGDPLEMTATEIAPAPVREAIARAGSANTEPTPVPGAPPSVRQSSRRLWLVAGAVVLAGGAVVAGVRLAQRPNDAAPRADVPRASGSVNGTAPTAASATTITTATAPPTAATATTTTAAASAPATTSTEPASASARRPGASAHRPPPSASGARAPATSPVASTSPAGAGSSVAATPPTASAPTNASPNFNSRF